ncbi:O-antigen ligase family protein [Paenibacillus sp. 7124]|uniref:O-antigen ligase family protein n=1 Tax=Paenibacillus apii TaxID=1850370 RepID=A0A6M1PY51_9BACL|nr:O-antigen ligase family protein [Paenibacillus apii]NGM85131.1 O-antigen ligase family protein [Paenibacillus apii]
MMLINHLGDRAMRKSGGYNGRAVKLELRDLCAVMVAGLVAAACLKRGLFFSGDGYPVLTIWFLLCGAAAASLLYGGDTRRSGFRHTGGLRRAEPNIPGSPSKERGSGRTRKELWATAAMLGGPAAMIILYAAAWIRGPLSAQGTMNELLRWSGSASFAILVWTAASSVSAGRLLWAAWHAAGMVLCWSGLLAFFGALPIPYAVLYSASPEVSASGARLGGLLQYPNAFGAAMAVFLLERLFAAAQSSASEPLGRKNEAGGAALSSRRGGGLARKARDGEGLPSGRTSSGRPGFSGRGGETLPTHLAPVGRGTPAARPLRGELLRLAPLFPYAAALLLSESRGAWLAAACAAAAALPLQRRLALPLLAAGAAPLAAAALLCRGLAALPAAPWPGLPLLAGLWAGALAAGLWLGRRAQHAAGRGRAAALMLAALGWTACGAAVLALVRARGTGPSSTVAARELMYRDAVRFAAEAPWLGRGGETWRSAWLAVQSRPYVGSQVHSGYLDLLLNTGVIGTAAAAVSLAAAGWLISAHSRRLLSPFLVIVLHGAVDFDWSYSLFGLLLFWLPALARAEAVTAYGLSGRRPSALTRSAAVFPAKLYPAKLLHAGRRSTTPSTANPKPANHLRGKSLTPKPLPMKYLPGRHNLYMLVRKLAATGICVLLLALCLLSFRAYRGEALYRAAVSARHTPEVVSLLERSLAWSPLSPKSALALSAFVEPESREEILAAGLRYSPINPALTWAKAVAVAEKGTPEEALYWLNRGLRLDVFNSLKRTEAASLMLAKGERYLAEGDAKEALRCAEMGEELLEQYVWLAGETAGDAGHNDRNFHFTAGARALYERKEALKREASGLKEEHSGSDAYAFSRR